MKKIEPPKGIRFADRESKKNYHRAIAGELNEYGFKPLIVITSPGPGKGKTRLALHILNSRFGSGRVSVQPRDEDQWCRLIPVLLKNGIPYLFLDDVRWPLLSPTLATFLTADEWTWRKLGEDSMDHARVDVQVIITGNNTPELSEKLARRSLWIELA